MTLKSLNTFAYTIFIVLFSLKIHAVKSDFCANFADKSGFTAAMPPPPTTFTYNNVVFCKNNPVSAMPVPIAGGPPPGGTYTFSPNPGLVINPNTGEIFPLNSTAGVYTVTYTGDMSAVTITIAPVAAAQISPPFVSICQGASQVLTALPSGAISYSWSTAGNLNFSSSNPITVSPSVTTAYSVTIKDAYGCIYPNITRSVTINPGPTNLTVNNRTLCAGGSVSVGVTGTVSSGTNFLWLPGAYNTSVITVAPNATTVYSLTASNAGCQKTYTVTVSVEPTITPTIQFNYPYPICTDSGDKFPIKDSGFVEGGTFYYTSVDGENLPIDPISGKINLTGIPVGLYFFTYSVAAQGCTLAANYTDDVPLGEVSYISVSKDMLITEGTGTILIASNATEYKWVPDIYLNCSDCPSPYVVAEKSQRYCVSDPTNGCAREACVLVEIVCVNRGDMSVPSAFTPNNDGRNDKFCLQGWKYCVSDFRIRIFNRWGQLVYETKENDFCWDGTFNGQDLDAGVYVYSIDAVLNREPYSKKGNITLIR